MNFAKSPYHHSNLEELLLDAAARIIDEHGVGALSLRALGDAVGVSRSAPYHYFADKDALLHRLSSKGFTALADATQAASAGITDPAQRGRAGLFGYLAFARAHPQLFRLMFAGVLPRHLRLPIAPGVESDDFSSLDAARAFAQFRCDVAALPDSAGLDANALVLRTNVMWAAVHGVAMLAIDENLKLVNADMVLASLLDRLIG